MAASSKSPDWLKSLPAGSINPLIPVLAFRSAAVHGEILVVDTRASADRRISITFSHVIRERTSQRLVVEGAATLVAVDSHGKIKRIPPTILQALNIATDSQAPS